MPAMGIITSMMNPPPGQRLARLLRRIAQQSLQKLRQHHGGAEQHDTERKCEEHGCGEVAPLEQLHVHNRERVTPLPQIQTTNAATASTGNSPVIRREPNQSSSWPLSSMICRQPTASTNQTDAHIIDARLLSAASAVPPDKEDLPPGGWSGTATECPPAR